MTDRDADLVVADDAELEGRLDVARELRARHLSPIELRADEYRMQLGLLPWRVHAEQVRTRVTDYGRRTGLTTSALLYSLARCEVEGWPTLAVFGEHAQQRAHDLIAALGLHGVTMVGVFSARGFRGRQPVAHIDHHDLETRRDRELFAAAALANTPDPRRGALMRISRSSDPPP